MPDTRRWFVLAMVLAGSLLQAQSVAPPAAPVSPGPSASVPAMPPVNGGAAANAAPASDATPEPDVPAHHNKSHKTPPPVVLPPMPSGPLSQMPMDQIPPTPAKVTYQGGLLTISAQNATLGEILRDVRKLTGASIEIPSSGAGERVVTRLGPGAPRDVLVALLNGSSFNYVMIGSNSDPAAVANVILTPKEAVAGQNPNPAQTAANMNQNIPGAMPPNRFPGPGSHPFNPGNGVAAPGTPAAEESKEDDQDTAEDNADDQAQPGQPTPPVPEATDANANAQPAPADPNQPNAGPKTPEQILEMLRRPQPPQPGGVTNPPQPTPQQ